MDEGEYVTAWLSSHANLADTSPSEGSVAASLVRTGQRGIYASVPGDMNPFDSRNAFQISKHRSSRPKRSYARRLPSWSKM